MMFGRSNSAARPPVDLSLERLSEIVALARAYRAGPVALSAGDLRSKADGDAPAPEEDTLKQQLCSAIAALSEDEQAVLVALAWIGLGDFTPAEFDHALTKAFDRRGLTTADYLVDLPALAETLENGVSACLSDIDAAQAWKEARSNGRLH